MIIAADQPKYDAYWNAYRRIQGSGLRITTHPVVGPLPAVARATYEQTLAAVPVGVDLGVLTDGLGMLGAAVGVTLVPAPVPAGAPPIIPGMDTYL